MSLSSTGIFITVEGGEGVGKSTQIKEVAKQLRRLGLDLVATREPGGTEGAEAIRALMLSSAYSGWDGWTEALLMLAARVEHARHIIEPALAKGQLVLCDRYIDSTLVYQGIARGLGIDAVLALHLPALRLPMPVRTFVLDAPLTATQARLLKRRPVDSRFDAEADSFHQTVRDGFLRLAQRYPERLTVIDASQPIPVVTAAMVAAIQDVMNRHSA